MIGLVGPVSLTYALGAPEQGELKVADTVSGCEGIIYGGGNKKNSMPINCLFLDEPIGGKPGYDLFSRECKKADKNKQPAEPSQCEYKLWTGGSIDPGKGPFQAILSYTPGKEAQGSLQLLYNYVGLIYKYLSGVIVGVTVLMTVVGGIQIITSHGSEGKTAGTDRILHSLLGMVLWFLASLILYTINPTFFRF